MFVKLAPDQRSMMTMEADPRPGQALGNDVKETLGFQNKYPPPPRAPLAAAPQFHAWLVFLDGSHICKIKAIRV